MIKEEYYKKTSGHNIALELPPNLRPIDKNIKKANSSKGCFYIEQPNNYVTFYRLSSGYSSCVPRYTFCRGVVGELYTCKSETNFELLGYITFDEHQKAVDSINEVFKEHGIDPNSTKDECNETIGELFLT